MWTAQNWERPGALSTERPLADASVWDHWEGDGYLPPGVHRLAERVSVHATAPPPDESPPRGDPFAEFTWEFSLLACDPGGQRFPSADS